MQIIFGQVRLVRSPGPTPCSTHNRVHTGLSRFLQRKHSQLNKKLEFRDISKKMDLFQPGGIFFNQVENLRILFALPWTRHIVPGWTGWNKQKQVKNVMSLPKAKFVGLLLVCFQVVEETQVLMRKIVKQVDYSSAKLSCLIFNERKVSQETSQQYLKSFQHVETFDEDNLRDFVDVYLKEIASSKDPAFNGNNRKVNILK